MVVPEGWSDWGRRGPGLRRPEYCAVAGRRGRIVEVGFCQLGYGACEVGFVMVNMS